MLEKFKTIFADIFQSKKHEVKLYAIKETIEETLGSTNVNIIFVTKNHKKAERVLHEIELSKIEHKRLWKIGKEIYETQWSPIENKISENLFWEEGKSVEGYFNNKIKEAEQEFISILTNSEIKAFDIYKQLTNEFDNDKFINCEYEIIEIENKKPFFEINERGRDS